MTRQQASVLWPVVKAWGEGEKIQCRVRSRKVDCCHPWDDYGTNETHAEPDFCNSNYEWRVKPKPREFWVVVNPFTNEIIQTYNSDPQVCHKIHPATTYVVIHCIEVTTP